MRRPNKQRTRKISGDSLELIELARQGASAGSRLERREWEKLLDKKAVALLSHNQQQVIDGVLESLFEPEPEEYDYLLDTVEACAESSVVDHHGQPQQILLIALPILAWTRFTIPSGPIGSELRNTLGGILTKSVLAPNVTFSFAPQLYAIDQLPQNHCETYHLTHALAKAALNRREAPASGTQIETIPFLADTRYFLCAIVAPVGAPLFRWQETPTPDSPAPAKTQCLLDWQQEAAPAIAGALPGCGVELLLPQAYFRACREGDQKIRPASIRAAVHYLVHVLDITAKDLTATIGMFAENGDRRIDEFRLAFSIGQEPEVVYGVVWPLYGTEDATEDIEAEISNGVLPPAAQVLALLREAGVTTIVQHDEIFPMEFCEDCGAPLYPDITAELVHPELPDNVPDTPPHFH